MRYLFFFYSSVERFRVLRIALTYSFLTECRLSVYSVFLETFHCWCVHDFPAFWATKGTSPGPQNPYDFPSQTVIHPCQTRDLTVYRRISQRLIVGCLCVIAVRRFAVNVEPSQVITSSSLSSLSVGIDEVCRAMEERAQCSHYHLLRRWQLRCCVRDQRAALCSPPSCLPRIR